MVAYAEVMCNRVIDILFLSIKTYLYDNLTNDNMINYLRKGIFKIFHDNSDDCKKLFETDPEIEKEKLTCKNNIEKLYSALKKTEKAYNNFYNFDEKNNNINKKNEKKNYITQITDKDKDSNNERIKNNIDEENSSDIENN
jgi:hypothetical protein